MKWNSIKEPPDCNIITHVSISWINLKKLPDWIFKCNNLIELFCYRNTLICLPELHHLQTLQILHCDSNMLTQLPKLPNSLHELYCYNNKLTHLPENLPDLLQKLLCFNNKLTCLPKKLPDSLTTLDCSYNKLIQLPNILPDSLKKIICENNKITQLPYILPKSLETLKIHNCKINEIQSSILFAQNLKIIIMNHHTYYCPLIKYFFENLGNKNIKKWCLDYYMKVVSEF